jgi:type VI protein secretion system component VasK
MKNFVTKENLNHRIMQFIILMAHLVLLKWIIYTLSEGGVLPFQTLMYHFLGISVSGGVLIRFCAWFYKKQYLKELEKNGHEPKLEK